MIPREYHHWESVINRMVGYANSRIKPDEAALILGYLSSTFVPQAPSGAEASPLDQYCSPCHSPAFMTNRHFDRKGWEEIVRRMSEHAPDIVPPDKISTIVDALERGNR